MHVIIMQGLPGSGKSLFARNYANDRVESYHDPIVSADQFFSMLGRFDPKRLPEAHSFCMVEYIRHLRSKGDLVIVDNTNIHRWEHRPYRSLAYAMGYKYNIVNLFDAGLDDEQLAKRNRHGVPEETIGRMRERYVQPYDNEIDADLQKYSLSY